MKGLIRRLLMIGGSIVVVAGLTFWVVTTRWLSAGTEPKADGSNEYALVLGAKVKKGNVPSKSLSYRLDAALQYAKQYPHVNLIVSGGQGPDEDATEGSVMQAYLVEHGLSPNRIIIEEKATTTYENIVYSLELLDQDISSLTIISSDYHLERAKMLADRLKLKVDVVAAKTPKIIEAKVRFRERFALVKSYILGK
ncbi:vancomycin resistance protein [Viridibacillus sp. FSL H8-0123]|nr:vancomycin resistance protein [Viridibacillus sp. FSL H8-0123]OMC86262.1 vancomycin resistance protein [Viridibacillus sp. FSL H7-0596]